MRTLDLSKKNKRHIMWSGILIMIFAPIIAIFVGVIFAGIEKSTGENSLEGAG
jgi:hypothetical protein